MWCAELAIALLTGVIPAKAGIRPSKSIEFRLTLERIPAFAGMTKNKLISHQLYLHYSAGSSFFLPIRLFSTSRVFHSSCHSDW
jgi:hypothetical protein